MCMRTSIRMCVYLYVCVCPCVGVYRCMGAWVCICTCAFACGRIRLCVRPCGCAYSRYVYVCVRAGGCMRANEHMREGISVYARSCICGRICACGCVYVYMCMGACVRMSVHSAPTTQAMSKTCPRLAIPMAAMSCLWSLRGAYRTEPKRYERTGSSPPQARMTERVGQEVRFGSRAG